MSFSRLTDSDTLEAATATSSEIRCPDKLPVLDLAIASGFVSELFVDVARANRLCGGEVDPPHATVTRGSFDFTLSGGLFASGWGYWWRVAPV